MESTPKFEEAPDPDKGGTPGPLEKELDEVLELDRIHDIQQLKLEILKLRSMQDVLNDLFRSGAVETSSTLDEVLQALATYESPEPPRKKAAENLHAAMKQYEEELNGPDAGKFFIELTKRHKKLMNELIEKIEPEKPKSDKKT